MTCLCKVTVDDLIRAFMHIANYKSWLRGGYVGKTTDSCPCKLKVVAGCEDGKLLVEPMKSYLGAEGLNIGDCALEGFKLFGSTKRKLNMPPGADCVSHRFDKVNYSIPRLDIKAKKTRKEKSLNSNEHGVAHTTSLLEIDCPSFHWHITSLPPNSTKRCWAMQANTGALCNVKVKTGKHGTPELHTKD